MPYPSTPPRRGEIYWVDHDPARGSEQAGRRPGLVISLDSFNRVVNTVAVLALITKVKPSKISVTLPAGDPLKEASQVLAFQILTIDKMRLDGYMGIVSAAQLKAIEATVKISWGLSGS